MDVGDSLARTPGDTCLLSGQVSTKSLFESISIYAEREVTMATPHALEPGGHSNTPNSTQKNKTTPPKKKEEEEGGKAIPIRIRKYYFFFSSSYGCNSP